MNGDNGAARGAGRNAEQEAFKRMMKLIPEATVKAIELNDLLLQHDKVLPKLAEEQLNMRGEPVTEVSVKDEMFRIACESSHEIADEWAQRRGAFAKYKAQQPRGFLAV